MSGFLDDLRVAATDAGDWFTRMQESYKVRRALWDGQTWDGRKHREALGRDPFPWEGAADTRIRTVDEVCNEQVMLMMQAFYRARMQASGIQSRDAMWGEKVTSLLKYVLWTKMKDQLRRELSLAANWRQWFGASVTAVMWDQSLRKMEQTITTEGLAGLMLGPEELQDPAMQQQGMEAARMVVADPAREELAIQLLMSLSSILDKRGARRALAELRDAGQTVIDVPEVYQAEPRILALLPMVDVFFPALTYDIQRAPWVAHREELAPEELSDRINTHGYDAKWVDRAIATKGVRFDAGGFWATNMALTMRGSAYGALANRDLVEVFHLYRKKVDDSGIPEVEYSVISAGVHDSVAVEGPLEYAHGQYPYIVHQREHLLRPILESRGVSEIAATWQYEIKTQRDARTDRTAVTVLPPLIVPARRGANRLRLGPGSQIPAAGRNEQYEWMRIPPYDSGSIEIERATHAMVGRYFGLTSEDVPQQLTAMHQASLVDEWLLEMRAMGAMILQLCQQYFSDADVARVVGALSRPWQLSRRDIQGEFDISVEMDPRDLNLENLKEKWAFIEVMLKYDRGGRVDYGKLVEFGLSGIDPSLAENILIPSDPANQAQVDDEQKCLTKMLAGIEPEMQPAPGMNYQLRAQVLERAIQANPMMQQRIAGQPDSQALIQNRLKFLQFQVQQQNNAQIGRVGAAPVMGGAL